jgi:hypothetical protein
MASRLQALLPEKRILATFIYCSFMISRAEGDQQRYSENLLPEILTIGS